MFTFNFKSTSMYSIYWGHLLIFFIHVSGTLSQLEVVDPKEFVKSVVSKNGKHGTIKDDPLRLLHKSAFGKSAEVESVDSEAKQRSLHPYEDGSRESGEKYPHQSPHKDINEKKPKTASFLASAAAQRGLHSGPNSDEQVDTSGFSKSAVKPFNNSEKIGNEDPVKVGNPPNEDKQRKSEPNSANPSGELQSSGNNVQANRLEPHSEWKENMRVIWSFPNYIPVNPRSQQPPNNYQPDGSQPPSNNYPPNAWQTPSNNYRPDGWQPPSNNYRPDGSQPPSNNYRPDEPQPSSNNYRPDETQPQSNNYRRDGWQPPSNNYRPDGPQPSSNNYRPEEPQPSSNNYRPEGPQPSSNNYRPEGPQPSSNNYGPEGPQPPSNNYPSNQSEPPLISYPLNGSQKATQENTTEKRPTSFSEPTGNQSRHRDDSMEIDDTSSLSRSVGHSFTNQGNPGSKGPVTVGNQQNKDKPKQPQTNNRDLTGQFQASDNNFQPNRPQPQSQWNDNRQPSWPEQSNRPPNNYVPSGSQPQANNNYQPSGSQPQANNFQPKGYQPPANVRQPTQPQTVSNGFFAQPNRSQPPPNIYPSTGPKPAANIYPPNGTQYPAFKPQPPSTPGNNQFNNNLNRQPQPQPFANNNNVQVTQPNLSQPQSRNDAQINQIPENNKNNQSSLPQGPLLLPIATGIVAFSKFVNSSSLGHFSTKNFPHMDEDTNKDINKNQTLPKRKPDFRNIEPNNMTSNDTIDVTKLDKIISILEQMQKLDSTSKGKDPKNRKKLSGKLQKYIEEVSKQELNSTSEESSSEFNEIMPSGENSKIIVNEGNPRVVIVPQKVYHVHYKVYKLNKDTKDEDTNSQESKKSTSNKPMKLSDIINSANRNIASKKIAKPNDELDSRTTPESNNMANSTDRAVGDLRNTNSTNIRPLLGRPTFTEPATPNTSGANGIPLNNNPGRNTT